MSFYYLNYAYEFRLRLKYNNIKNLSDLRSLRVNVVNETVIGIVNSKHF